MKCKNVFEGMEVKLRKNINKCTHTSENGTKYKDCDLNEYSGGDTVQVTDLDGGAKGVVWVKKMDATAIKVNAKNLRKIK